MPTESGPITSRLNESVQRIPYYVEMATRNAIYGRPGPKRLGLGYDVVHAVNPPVACAIMSKARLFSMPCANLQNGEAISTWRSS